MDLCWQKMLHGWRISKSPLRTKNMTWRHCAESVSNTIIPTIDICWWAHHFKPSLSSYCLPAQEHTMACSWAIILNQKIAKQVTSWASQLPHFSFLINEGLQIFPGGPVVNTLPSNAGGVGWIPGWGVKMPHTSGPKTRNIKQKQYCNKFNKDFKNSPCWKKIFK